MLVNRKYVLGILFTVVASTPALAVTNDAAWQEIIAPKVANVDGRDIQPSCSDDSDYKFYYKQGDADKLLVFMNGGGACWNYTTCVVSPNTPISSYVPNIDAHNMPQPSGIFDSANPDNPYNGWSMVFLPYCSGDVHWGSSDTTYTGPDLSGSGTLISKTIRHRGFDNFLFARNWMKNNFTKLNRSGVITSSVEKVTVAGSSAGAYGVTVAFPHIKSLFPKSRAVMLSDAGSGVITENFLDEAIQNIDAAWNVKNNFATTLPGVSLLFSDGVNADTFLVSYYSILAASYPRDRFAQYTTAWDAVQVFFTNIMSNENDITQWPALSPQKFRIWNYKATLFSNLLASWPNYRFYIAPGCNHTALRFNDATFSNDTVSGVTFRDWVKKSIDGDRDEWINAMCDGYCGVPTTNEQVGACLNRSFGG